MTAMQFSDIYIISSCAIKFPNILCRRDTYLKTFAEVSKCTLYKCYFRITIK